MQTGRTLKAPSDRTLNRMVIGAILILVIGIPLVIVLYVADRWVDPGPALVNRQVQTLETAVKADPNNVNVRLQLVGAYIADNRDADALTQLNQVLGIQSNNKSALLARGDLYNRRHDLEPARKDYQAIVDMMKDQEFAAEDREYGSALFGLAQVAIAANKPADAIAPLTTAAQMDGANADVLNLLGVAYLATGDAEKAIPNLRRAIAFVPTGWCEPYQSLSEAYGKQGNADEAAWATAMVDFCQKQPDKAKQALTALVGGPAAADAYLGLGMVAEQQGDRAGAATAYQKVLDRDPSNFNAQAGLSRATEASPAPGDTSTPTPTTPPTGVPASGGNS